MSMNGQSYSYSYSQCRCTCRVPWLAVSPPFNYVKTSVVDKLHFPYRSASPPFLLSPCRNAQDKGLVIVTSLRLSSGIVSSFA